MGPLLQFSSELGNGSLSINNERGLEPLLGCLIACIWACWGENRPVPPLVIMCWKLHVAVPRVWCRSCLSRRCINMGAAWEWGFVWGRRMQFIPIQKILSEAYLIASFSVSPFLLHDCFLKKCQIIRIVFPFCLPSKFDRFLMPRGHHFQSAPYGPYFLYSDSWRRFAIIKRIRNFITCPKNSRYYLMELKMRRKKLVISTRFRGKNLYVKKFGS